MEFKSLLGVLMAQVGVPKLPRHAQGDRQQSEKARRPTPRHAQSTAQPPRVTQDFHRSRVGEAHEVLRRTVKRPRPSGPLLFHERSGLGRMPVRARVVRERGSPDADR